VKFHGRYGIILCGGFNWYWLWFWFVWYCKSGVVLP